MAKKKGLFITFEGGDGAGKTTLIESLHMHLEKGGKRQVVKTREPGATSVGKEIRKLVLHSHALNLVKRCELLLFLADRAQHVEELILPALKKGQVVLCDRFNDSTIAYQSGARGLDEKAVRSLCNFACDKLTPDLTIYLDLDPKIGLKRVQKAGRGESDRIEAETLKFHQMIRTTYLSLVKKHPKRFFLIDASKTPEEVYLAAKERIDAIRSLT